MTNISEYTIQQTFKQWCDKQDFIALHWHIPNGMHASSKEGRLFKQQGLRKGMPDYWVLLKNKKLIVIEFKTAIGKLSAEQQQILHILTECNIPNRVCRSAHEAVQFVREFA